LTKELAPRDSVLRFPEEIRKIVYTTNAVESLHMTLRKVTRNRGSFPTQDAAIKLLYLALQNVSKKCHTVQNWRDALRQFSIRWPERMQLGLGGEKAKAKAKPFVMK
jgi:putative transposase